MPACCHTVEQRKNANHYWNNDQKHYTINVHMTWTTHSLLGLVIIA